MFLTTILNLVRQKEKAGPFSPQKLALIRSRAPDRNERVGSLYSSVGGVTLNIEAPEKYKHWRKVAPFWNFALKNLPNGTKLMYRFLVGTIVNIINSDVTWIEI